MILKLNSLPDCVTYHQYLKVGGKYEIRGIIGNGYVINICKAGKSLEDGLVSLLILASRFGEI